MADSVADAKRAVELDPLSPSNRNAYISALAYAGNFEAARRELDAAERLWPGTATVRDAQFRFHLRYGDPNIARSLSDDASKGMRLYLQARSEPTRANVDPLFEHMEALIGRVPDPLVGLSFVIQAHGEFKRNDELFKKLLAWPNDEDLAIVSDVLFRPQLKEFRRDPRFTIIAKRAKLIDYWRQSGNWPDFCFDADQPYDCKKEAARLNA